LVKDLEQVTGVEGFRLRVWGFLRAGEDKHQGLKGLGQGFRVFTEQSR
jgi:hypothetical protein